MSTGVLIVALVAINGAFVMAGLVRWAWDKGFDAGIRWAEEEYANRASEEEESEKEEWES